MPLAIRKGSARIPARSLARKNRELSCGAGTPCCPLGGQALTHEAARSTPGGHRSRSVDVAVTGRGRPFTGASGQRKADKLETEGVNIRARKP